MNFNEFIKKQGETTIPNPEYNPRSKKNKGPRTLDIIDLSADKNPLLNVVKKDLERSTRVDYDDIKKYEKAGIHWNPRDAANGSLDIQLAEAQSNWSKLGNALAQTLVSEIGLGTLLGISDLFDAVGQAIGKSDHDYNNPVSAKLEEWQDKFNNEVAPIYSRPGSGFGNGTDFGWWMQNIPSIASSLTLLIPAAGGTKLLSMAGKAALKGTKAATKWAGKAAKLDKVQRTGRSIGLSSKAVETGKLFAKNATTAALSRTMENYQEARQVYNDMYANVLDSLNQMDDEEYNNFINRNQNTVKGVDTSNKDDVAKAVAKQSSDMTFKADYANTVFDILQLYALRNVAFHGFRNSKVSAAARRLDKNSRRFAGKYNTVAELEELAAKQSFGRKAADKIGDILYTGRTVVAAEASEGIEEAVNYIAQQEGMEVGKSMLSMEANTTFSSRLKQYMKNPELWESAFWGVMGGIVFQGAGSGFARAKTAIEKKNELKKNKPNEKTGENVNAKTTWKALWELPDVKRVKASIENRIALENNYQKNVKDILEDNKSSNEEKELLLQHLREQRRTDLALNAMDSGTIDMLKSYLEDDNVKQALIDKGVVSKEQADVIQAEDLEAIQKVQDAYDSNVRDLNAISRNINAKNGTVIPTEYLQIIARDNIASQLSIENFNKQLNNWTEEAEDLHRKLDEQGKLDKNINYKELIRLEWLTRKLGELEADKKQLLKNKEEANSISGQERLKEFNNNINTVRNLVAELNPENKLENMLYAIETSLSYEKQGDTYKATGINKDYLDFRKAVVDKNTKFFEDLDKRLVGIEERHFGAQEIIDQNITTLLGNEATSISNVSQELGSAYATLAALQYAIATEKTNIKLTEKEVEDEAKSLHNYMNEVRLQKIKDATATLEGLADKYGSNTIRNLAAQRYNGESLNFNDTNVSEEDKALLNDSLDTLHLDEKLNSDLAKSIDVILSTHDDIKVGQQANIDSKTMEFSSTSQNPDLAVESQKMDNVSTEPQKPQTSQENGQNGQNTTNNVSETTNVVPQSQSRTTNVKSGLNTSNISDGTSVTFMGDYSYVGTSNPEEFKVDFAVSSKNVKHFNNPDLFTQEEGVDLTVDNYIVGKKPIINTQGNVVEKGMLVLATQDNVAQAEANNEEDLQEAQSLASTGEVVQTSTPTASITPNVQVVDNTSIPTSPEQLAGPVEEKTTNVSPEVAEIPYDANDVISQANAAMINELQAARAEGREANWTTFRESLTTKFEQANTPSQYLNEQIERVISKGKELAARKGIKSVDAIMDVMSKSSRLRENTSNAEAQQGFSESVNKLIDVFNSEVGIDIVNGKKYVNIEALCRYCDKILNDKLSARLLVNNLIELARKDKNLVVTDNNTDRIQERLKKDINSFDTSEQQLGIDYFSVLRQVETSRDENARKAFYEVIDNIQPGDKIDITREDRGLIFTVNGVKIGSLPYPKVSNDGTLYQDNDNWNTDIKIIQGGNVQSKLQDLFIRWATDISNSDIKELNDIILQYLDPDYTGDKSELVKHFKENNEVKKAVANKFTVDNPDYERLLEGIAKVWRYTRANGGNFDGSILEARQQDIQQWFKERVAPSYVFIQKIKENPNLEVEVNKITEGDRIETKQDKKLPVSKAIGSNHKGKVKLGICLDNNAITLVGGGINGSTRYEWSQAKQGRTWVAIPARDGNHAFVHAFRQKVSSNSISKTAKDIKNAIYSEIRRICSDDKMFQDDKAKTLQIFLRKVLPVYTQGTNKPNSTASFFDSNVEEGTNITIGDNPKNSRGFTFSYRTSKNDKNVYIDVWNDGIARKLGQILDNNQLAEEIISAIENCCTFNLSFAAINSDLGHTERQYLTKKGANGEYIVSIPNQGDFTFASYNDFILDNDLVLATTEPTPDGRSNFNRISDNYRANQQLYVKISNDTTSPVEESIEESKTPTIIANPRETEILNVLNSKRIKNKAEKLADLLFGKKVRKSLSFGKTQYNLFPKNIIFVDENLIDNAIVNTSDKPVIDNEHNGLIIPAKTVVLGKEWLEMATSNDLEERKQAAKKLIHEQLHILLTGENSKYIEQIREVFDEFAEKNTNEELNKYLYKWDEARYYTDGKLNQEGLEEFLVETLTSNELANALNNIETISTEDKTKKESLFQKIMKVLAKILGIDIKQGSLYEKEFKLLRDVLSSDNQLEINFEEQQNPIIELNTNELLNVLDSNVSDVLSDDDMDIFGSRIRENINNSAIPSISSYVSTFPLSEQSELIDKIENGEISISCK